MELGVNVDHVATVRNARGEISPSPVHAAFVVLESGASNVTCHLREDRRHIKDEDIRVISSLTGRLNMEMASDEEIVSIALEVKPRSVTIVPEKRKELTTEGGLDVVSDIGRFSDITGEFKLKVPECMVSAFIEPDIIQVEAARKAGFGFIEIHTGNYASQAGTAGRNAELSRIKAAADHANRIGLGVNAGHGLDYRNIYDIAMLEGFNEFNIGFSIVSRAIFTGLENAVKEMLAIIKSAELAKYNK